MYRVARRALSSAVALPQPPVSSLAAGSTGVMGALKRVLGPDATGPLPPGYTPDPATASAVPTRITTLANGLRVASEQSATGTATVGVWIDAGTRFEGEPRLNGAAHFCEHIMFKGTPRLSQRELEVSIEDRGAVVNAFTSREQTVYYGRSLKDDVPFMTGLIADIVQNSTIPESAVDRERSVILREMQEIDQIPEEVVFDYLHSTAFQDCALGRTILGPVENINSLTSADLKTYMDTNHKPHRMVLAAAGDIDHDKLVALAEKHFGDMPVDPTLTNSSDLVAADPAYLVGSDVRIRNDDMSVAHFAIAFESCGWNHPDAVAFMVLQALVGNYDRAATTGINSSFRVAAGLAAVPNAKSSTCFSTVYQDTGLFGVYATGEPQELDDIAYVIMNEFVRLCNNVDSVHLENAKISLKNTLEVQLDGSTAIAEEIGRQVLVYGRRIPMSEWFARIDAIDVDAVKRVANKYIYDREIAVTAMGPIASLPDYTWLRRRTFSNAF
jgi:mitochondrial-processing peptidase subunit beta